jgi:hypothetical protein
LTIWPLNAFEEAVLHAPYMSEMKVSIDAHLVRPYICGEVRA